MLAAMHTQRLKLMQLLWFPKDKDILQSARRAERKREDFKGLGRCNVGSIQSIVDSSDASFKCVYVSIRLVRLLSHLTVLPNLN